MTVFEIKEQALDALSQMEKQHMLLNETGGFTSDTAALDLKTNNNLLEMTTTNQYLTGHAHLLNQSKAFGGTATAMGTGLMNTMVAANNTMNVAGIGNNLAKQLVGKDQMLVDGSFSNNLGQSFLGNSNYNSELLPFAA